jgi:uncharacterized protein YndB with AHSA1/START domain
MNLVIKRVLPATRERVFRAWSDPSVMARWFFAELGWSARVNNEFRVGGSYQLDMLDQGLTVFSAHGEYTEIAPVSRLAFTWNSSAVSDTLVVIELRELGDSTELTLTHRSLPGEEEEKRHAGGWVACLGNLLTYLS